MPQFLYYTSGVIIADLFSERKRERLYIIRKIRDHLDFIWIGKFFQLKKKISRAEILPHKYRIEGR